jgi:hypothetical protein
VEARIFEVSQEKEASRVAAAGAIEIRVGSWRISLQMD